MISNKVISPTQAGFIPGRQILDNALLASKLIKGHGKGKMSPRCMIKIDSVEWSFIKKNAS